MILQVLGVQLLHLNDVIEERGSDGREAIPVLVVQVEAADRSLVVRIAALGGRAAVALAAPALRLGQDVHRLGRVLERVEEARRKGHDLGRVAEQRLDIFGRVDEDHVGRALVDIDHHLHVLAKGRLGVHQLLDDMAPARQLLLGLGGHGRRLGRSVGGRRRGRVGPRGPCIVRSGLRRRGGHGPRHLDRRSWLLDRRRLGRHVRRRLCGGLGALVRHRGQRLPRRRDRRALVGAAEGRAAALGGRVGRQVEDAEAAARDVREQGAVAPGGADQVGVGVGKLRGRGGFVVQGAFGRLAMEPVQHRRGRVGPVIGVVQTGAVEDLRRHGQAGRGSDLLRLARPLVLVGVVRFEVDAPALGVRGRRLRWLGRGRRRLVPRRVELERLRHGRCRGHFVAEALQIQLRDLFRVPAALAREVRRLREQALLELADVLRTHQTGVAV